MSQPAADIMIEVVFTNGDKMTWPSYWGDPLLISSGMVVASIRVERTGKKPSSFPDDFIEMLEAWLTMHRRSPLDGTISCRICRALVLESNKDTHEKWHTLIGQHM